MPPRVSRFLRYLSRAFNKFVDDGGFYLAAAISFYALVSFIPLLLIIINLFVYVLGRSHDLQAAVFGYVNTLYPLAGVTLKREIGRILRHRGRGWIGLVVFLWLSTLAFDSIEFSLNKIFKSSGKRRFIATKLLTFGLVLLSGVVFMLSFWAAYLPAFLKKHPNIITRSETFAFISRSFFVQLTPFLLTLLAFTAIYKLLPARKVSLRQAAFAGVVAAVLWETAKYAFAWYVGNISLLGVYGSLSAIIFFMLWIYYSSLILLFVGEGLYIGVYGKKG